MSHVSSLSKSSKAVYVFYYILVKSESVKVEGQSPLELAFLTYYSGQLTNCPLNIHNYCSILNSKPLPASPHHCINKSPKSHSPSPQPPFHHKTPPNLHPEAILPTQTPSIPHQASLLLRPNQPRISAKTTLASTPLSLA